MPFFLFFILIPLAEIIVFMNVSDVIGLGTALIIALLTAILGGAIVRYQGTQTLRAARGNMRRGVLPSHEIFDGLCLVAAGATLITPGFITDALGFALLIPPLREFLRKKLMSSGRFKMSGFQDNGQGAHTNPFAQQQNPHDNQDPSIIDGEYEKLDEDKHT